MSDMLSGDESLCRHWDIPWEAKGLAFLHGSSSYLEGIEREDGHSEMPAVVRMTRPGRAAS
jgi:hypothetical protein